MGCAQPTNQQAYLPPPSHLVQCHSLGALYQLAANMHSVRQHKGPAAACTAAAAAGLCEERCHCRQLALQQGPVYR